jgi:hypothetical protein
LEALLDGDDSMALIRSLPAEDLFVVIREVGIADCADVVALCSPEQFQSFLDLDAWRGDRFQADRYGSWVLALRRGRCRDLAGMLGGVDPEIQALALKESIYIQELEEDEDPDPHGVFVMDTPDRRYRVSVVSDDEELIELVKTQLGAMLARGPIHLSAYLSQISWQLASQLEEASYQFRRGRLADLGFPDPEEARVLEAPLPSVDAAIAQAGGPANRSPDSAFTRALVARSHGSLLHRALAGIDDALLAARVAQDLVQLCNGLLVLWGVDPGELETVRHATTKGMAMIELTLRRVAGEDLAAATQVLSRTPARTLYRVAVTLLHDLQVRARTLSRLLERLPTEDQAFVLALAKRPPLQEGGAPFSKPSQIDAAEGRLVELEDLGGWLAEVSDPISALQAYGSVVVRRNLELGHSVAPVSAAEFGRFLTRFDDGLFEGATALGDRRLRAEWAGLWGQAAPDVRFVGGIWLKPAEETP